MLLFTIAHCYDRKKETDIREQKKYEKRIQTCVDNAVNGLRYEIKFEYRMKDKNNFFIK